MTDCIHPTREAYLQKAVELFIPLFSKAGATIPSIHVSTGWPSTRATSAKRKALGEAWSKDCSEDGKAQVFISPYLSDPLHVDPASKDACGVLPTLVHEVVHTVVGNKAGHGPVFRKLAEAVGLSGKMTATHAGAELLEYLESIQTKLGKYPHAKLQPGLSGKKKQGTRMVKCECSKCGYTVRTTKKWLEIGAPICPVDKITLTFELPEDGEEEGEE